MINLAYRLLISGTANRPSQWCIHFLQRLSKLLVWSESALNGTHATARQALLQ